MQRIYMPHLSSIELWIRCCHDFQIVRQVGVHMLQTNISIPITSTGITATVKL